MKCPPARTERSGWFDEVLPLLRRLWSGGPVDHVGDRFTYEGVRTLPTPVQDPLVGLTSASPVPGETAPDRSPPGSRR